MKTCLLTKAEKTTVNKNAIYINIGAFYMPISIYDYFAVFLPLPVRFSIKTDVSLNFSCLYTYYKERHVAGESCGDSPIEIFHTLKELLNLHLISIHEEPMMTLIFMNSYIYLFIF